jgi:hypothetical protein
VGSHSGYAAKVTFDIVLKYNLTVVFPSSDEYQYQRQIQPRRWRKNQPVVMFDLDIKSIVFVSIHNDETN